MFSKLKNYGVAFASVAVVIGAVLMFFAPLFFNMTRSFVLSITTKPTFELWRKNPMPLYLEFYIFNWTNPEDVHKPDVKPRFREIGPFVFEETKEKVNITVNENNTVTFRQLRYWYFREDMSYANLSTPITTLNSIVVFAAYMIKDWTYVLRKGFDITISAQSTKLYKQTTIAEVLFDGYEDPLINLARSMPQMKDLNLPPYDKFGWFYERNGSYVFDGTFNMVGSGLHFGETKRWNYKTNMSMYSGQCDTVRGSAGEFYSADRTRDKIGFFSPDICRYVPLDYDRDVEVDGTMGYKYVLGESFFDNGTHVSENRCYCGDYCTPYGVLNISACRYGAPAFVSQPHFYGADPYYTDKVSGLNPVKEKHQMFMVVEPITGIPLHVEARLQLNILVQHINSIRILEDIPAFIFPVMWFEQKARIPTGLHFLLKTLLHQELILRCIGAVMLIVALPWLFLVLRPSFAQKTCWKSSKDTYAMGAVPRHEVSESGKPLMVDSKSGTELESR